MNIDTAVRTITILMALMAAAVSLHRPNKLWARISYALVFVALGAVSFGLQLKLAGVTQTDKLAIQSRQAEVQAKLDQAQHFLQVAEGWSRDCNVKIDAVDARLLVMSKTLTPNLRKEVQAIHRHFERGVSETLQVQDTVKPR